VAQIPEVADRHVVGLDNAHDVVTPLGAAIRIVIGRQCSEDDSAMGLLSHARHDQGLPRDHLDVVVVRVVVADHDDVSRLLQRPVGDRAAESAGFVGVGDDLSAVRGGDQEGCVTEKLDLHCLSPSSGL